MSKLFKKPDLTPRQGKNGFDLSFRRLFTSPCGMLLPVAKDFATPGEKYVLNSDTFVRTEAVQTAAFMRLKAHVDWFFVPVTQLYSLWNEFFNSTQDIMSTSFYGETAEDPSYKLPLFSVFPEMARPQDISYFSAAGTTNKKLYPKMDPFGVPYLYNFRRLWDMLGYGSMSTSRDFFQKGNDTSETSTLALPLLDFLAYHKIFHSHYLVTDWFKNDPTLYNVDQYYSASTPLRNNETMYRILSTIHYRPYRKDFFTDVKPSPLFSNAYANFIQSDMMSLTSQNGIINPELIKTNPQAAAVLADVQKSIAEQTGVFGLKVGLKSSVDGMTDFNHNSLYFGKVAEGQRTDVFGSALNSGGTIPTYIPEHGVNFQMVDEDGNVLNPFVNSGSNPDPNPSPTPQAIARFSAADVRSAFALDKLLRVTAFGGSHYEDQIEAHFGYKMPRGISKEAYFLGSQTTDINITEVVSTASTGADGAGSVLGDIAGKGYSSPTNNSDIHFEAPCHGFIMAIFSIEPIVDYASRQCEVQNRYTDSYDFYHPEFDNVGMQPLYGQFLQNSIDPNSQQLSGWQYRWMELKTKFDIVNECFWDTDKRSWVGSKQSVFDQDQGENNHYVFNPHQVFYIMPQYTNDIFLQSFPYYEDADRKEIPFVDNDSFNSPWFFYPASQNQQISLQSSDVYQGDNFLMSCFFKIYKSSPMSVHSLPKML